MFTVKFTQKFTTFLKTNVAVFLFSLQAWWFTENVATDVWFRWIKVNGVWNATDLPSTYPQGTHTHTHTGFCHPALSLEIGTTFPLSKCTVYVCVLCVEWLD